MQITVKNLDNADIGNIEVDDAIFGLPVRKDILSRVVDWQLAKRRAGTHKAKERGEVRATSGKMWRQKGTGRARHGNRGAGQFRGGGVVHGPRVRDHGFSLPKKVRRLGLKTALSSKQKDGKLIVVDAFASDGGRTADLAKRLTQLGVSSALFIGGSELDASFTRAASNIAGIDVLPQQGANVYDILRRDTLILSREAVELLEARLK